MTFQLQQIHPRRRLSFLLTGALTGALTVLLVALQVLSPLAALAQEGPASTTAATWFVDGNTGSDSGACNAASAACKTIQSAVDRAGSGDTILVAGSGGGIVYTYAGGSSCTDSLGAQAVVCIAQKQLILRGGYPSGSFSGYNPAQNITILDGQGRTRGVAVMGFGKPGATAVEMAGFTVRNGYGSGISKRPAPDNYFGFGGGMIVEETGTLTLRDMLFDANRAVGNDRTSGEEGGAGAGGGLSLRATPNTNLENVRFTNNQAIGGSGPKRGGYAQGGAIFSYISTVNGSNVTFENNQARAGSSGGSGVASNGERADALGGATSFSQGSSVTLNNVSARSNQAIGGNAATFAGGAFGGAFFGEDAQITLNDAAISANLAQGGVGENGWLGSGGGLMAIHSTVTLNRAVVIANTAQGGNGRGGKFGVPNGGGVTLSWVSNQYNSRLNMTNSIIANNRALKGEGQQIEYGGGGGLWIQSTEATIEHSTIANNALGSGPGQFGQGMVLFATDTAAGKRASSVTIRNSLITGHSGSEGSAVEVFSGSSVTFAGGLFYKNTWDTSAGNPNQGGSVGAINGQNTMGEANPLYVAPAAPQYDYHLQTKSPARDKAVGSQQPVDVDNETRSDGKPDYGADEFSGPATLPLAYKGLTSGRTSISLSWDVDADTAAAASSYRLKYNQVGGGPGEKTVDAGKATSYTLRNLTPYALYSLQVDALDAAGNVIAGGGLTGILTSDRKVHMPSVRR